MPKYTVQEVLDIIAGLSADEKVQLQKELPTVLATNFSNPAAGNVQTRTVSIGGDFSVSGHRNAVDMSQQQTITTSSLSHQGTDLEAREAIAAAMASLASLKQAIQVNPELNPVVKRRESTTVDILEEELKKPQPDKSLIAHAVESLKQGLEGVLTLAGPTQKVAELLAGLWIGV